MYRVEIFDFENRAFADAFMLDKSNVIYDDYLSPRKFDIKAPADISCDVKYTIKISDETKVLFSGYIDEIQRLKDYTILTIAPLIMFLNEKSIQNTTSSEWARQIDWQIYYDFRRTSPSLYSLPFYRYNNTNFSNWGAVTVPYGADLKNDMECIILARQVSGKFLHFGLGTSASWLGVPHYGYRKFTSTQVIEADLENIIDKQITETSDQGYNIGVVWVVDQNNPNAYNYYTLLLINGDIIIGASRKSEITDPRLTEKVFSTYRTFTTTELTNLGKQMLKPSSDSLEILLTVPKDDLIINPYTMNIGKPVTIYRNSKTYDTYLTGKEYHRDYVILKFGMVRQSLTSKLNSEDN